MSPLEVSDKVAQLLRTRVISAHPDRGDFIADNWYVTFSCPAASGQSVTINLGLQEVLPVGYIVAAAKGIKLCYPKEQAELFANSILDIDPSTNAFRVVKRTDSSNAEKVDPATSTSRKTSPAKRAEKESATRRTASRSPTVLNEAKAALNELIGLPEVKKEIAHFEAFLKIQAHRKRAGLATGGQTLHFVFQGNPGTGKTTVARILGKLLSGYNILKKGHVVETDRAGLVAEYLGQTAIKTDSRISEALDGILFIDEVYSLVSSTDKGDSYGREAIDTLLKRMEDYRDRLVVVVAGYPRPMGNFINSNPGLKSRFTRYIAFEDYSPVELVKIFEHFADQAHYKLAPAAAEHLLGLFNHQYARRDDQFGNARDVRNMFEQATRRQAMRLTSATRTPTKKTLQLLLIEDLPTLSEEERPHVSGATTSLASPIVNASAQKAGP